MDDLDDVRRMWDRVADDWRIQVGDDGDGNRRLNSDPVLWSFAGEVRGRRILDAGCGTGYLSRQLAARGAHVIGVDLSPRMIAIAKADGPAIDFRVDACGQLATVPDASCDLVIANYVLMDTPDLDAAVRAFHRVLAGGGAAVLVFSHPCFPQGEQAREVPFGGMSYDWPESYFDARRHTEPPWGHFRSTFLWFHRPLSAYWKAFRQAGFAVEEFDEPRITPERYALAQTTRRLANSLSRPYSVAFKLRKPAALGTPGAGV